MRSETRAPYLSYPAACAIKELWDKCYELAAGQESLEDVYYSNKDIIERAIDKVRAVEGLGK